MRSFKQLASVLLTAIISAACTQVETGRIVLQGEITGDPGDVVVVSFLPGQKIGYHYPEVADGRFEFSLDDVEDFADLIVSVGGVEFGARINALDTLRMGFTVNKYLEDVAMTYNGANEKEALIWKDFFETYERPEKYGIVSDYFMDEHFADNITRLDRNDSLFRAKYGKELDKYHIHRADLAHDLLKAILLDLNASFDNSESFDLPEYKAMIDRVDPNDPDQVVFPMVNRWKAYKQYGMEGSELEKQIKFMQQYGAEITNPDIRQMLAENMIPSAFWQVNIDSLDAFEPFMDELEKFAPNGAELVEDCRGRIQALLNSKPGAAVPDTFLKTPDGKEVQLSSLFGKVLYVDIWATWCGPCVKEGPHFKALAEKYKDDPRICFISISTDKTDEPWLEFLAEEKPFWPQYRLDGKNHNDFCTKVGIHAIPRFLLIDKEGRFINADCARPSSDNIEQILNKAL